MPFPLKTRLDRRSGRVFVVRGALPGASLSPDKTAYNTPNSGGLYTILYTVVFSESEAEASSPNGPCEFRERGLSKCGRGSGASDRPLAVL